MKKLDNDLGYGGRRIGKEFKFVRSGKSSCEARRTTLSQEDESYILDKAKKAMRLSGYL